MLPPVDREAAARAIDDFLRALGHDPGTEPDLEGTGRRVADAWADDLLDGEAIDPVALLRAESFPLASDGPGSLVSLRKLSIATMCPHHLLPALGTADVAYVPGGRVTGLGTLSKALDALAHRMTLQERIGEEFVAAVIEGLDARGAACRIRLRHACLSARGSRKEAWVESLATAGALAPGGSHVHLLQTLAR
jgi:GTP cyclohydrolase IA